MRAHLLLVSCLVASIPLFVEGIAPPQVESLIILEPRPIVNVPGRSTLRLQCSASGDPIPVYSWKKDETVLTEIPNKIIITGSVLEVRNINKSADDGLYKCLATNTQGTVFMEINIVNYIMGRFKFPDRVQDPPIHVNVKIGRQAIIPCPSHGPTYPEIIQWGDLQDGKVPELWKPERHRFFAQNGDLVFPAISAGDIEEINNLQGISCLLYNDKVYEQSKKFTIRSLGPETVIERPRFMISLQPTFTEVKGKRLVLRCGATGSPIPTVRWFKDNIEIKMIGQTSKSNFDRFRILGGGVELTVDLVHERDRGLYKCEVNNIKGRLVSMGTLIVHLPPEWLKMVNDASVPIHGSHQLNCSAFGDPSPTYEWYKNGSLIKPSSNPRLKVNKNVLTLERVLQEDSGMYICLARNPHGAITTTSQITVTTMAPKFEPPIPDPIYLFRNRENKVPCRPIGGPVPITKWEKDNAPIVIDSRHVVNADGTLVVTNPIASDAGVYKCIADNSEGSAESSGLAKVVDPTVVATAPSNISINVGFHVQLFCDATHDPNLELKIDWMKDGQLITYFDDRIYLDWRVSGPSRVLTIKTTEFNDRGAYTCHAYTALDHLVSEDYGTGYLTIRDRPDPPTGIDPLDSCADWGTLLNWKTASSNGDIVHYLIVEYSSMFKDDGGKWYTLNPRLGPGSLERFQFNELPGNADLIFRLYAVNKIGTSDASLPSLAGKCVTPPHAPWKNPRAWGHPTTAGRLSIKWERFTKIHQGGSDFQYIVSYRRVTNPPSDVIVAPPIRDFNITTFEIPDPGTYQLYEFSVVAKNSLGSGPDEGMQRTFSGQNAPKEMVSNFFVKTKGPGTLVLEWTPVSLPAGTVGSIDGYKVYYWNWTEPQGNRVRRDEPVVNAFNITFDANGGTTRQGDLGNLTSITTYYLIIKPFNSGGEGPGSPLLTVQTQGTISSPPHNVRVNAFGSVLFVQWEPPLRSSGVVFDYHINIENSSFTRQTGQLLQSLRYEYWERFTYIANLEPTHYYTLKMAARNRFGMGNFYEWIVATSFPDKPGKPKRPSLVPIDAYGINCTFNLADSGGFPSSFVVYYRPKGDTLSKVGMVSQQFPKYHWVLVSGLSPNPFEFWVVAKNSLGDSEPSDVIEAMPKPYAPSREEFVSDIAWYRSNWFIAMCVAVAFLLLVLVVVLILIQRNGSKYQVARREQARAGWNTKTAPNDYNTDTPYDDYSSQPLKNDFADNRPPPRYPSNTSVDKGSPSDENDSLDDYGEDTKFDEDGSFMGQYGEEKRRSTEKLQDKEDPDMSTFV